VNENGLRYLTDREQTALREFLTKLREQHGSEVVLVSLFGSKVLRGDRRLGEARSVNFELENVFL